jgi:hypothetical protein
MRGTAKSLIHQRVEQSRPKRVSGAGIEEKSERESEDQQIQEHEIKVRPGQQNERINVQGVE